MKKQYVYAFVSVLLWSTTGAVSKLLLGALSSMQVLAASCGYALVFLLVQCTVKGKWQRLRACGAKDYLAMAGNGLLGIFAYNLFLFLGIARIMASQAMIINYLWPMMAVAAACVLLKEKLTARKAIAMAMSFLGVIVVSSGGGTGPIDPVGVGLCVLAAIAYGIFVVLNKRLPYDAHLSMTVYYAVSFLVSTLCVFAGGETMHLDGIQHLGMAWIGIATYAIAYVTWALAMRGGETVKIANLSYITPFLSLVWTFFLVGEPITARSVIGLAVIVAGIFVQLK